jgi:hypothetical protein
MQVIITKKVSTDSGFFCELSCGKQSCEIWVSADHVMVCNKNASHRAWGGIGKRFDSLADALNGYKSSAMKAMIQTAAEVA